MKKRYLAGLGAVVLLGIIVIFAVVLPKLHKGTVNLNMTGGDPTFGVKNIQMAEFNKAHGYAVTVVSPDKVTDFKDMSIVDLVQGGSITAIDDLRAREGVTVYGEYIMSTSPNMIWVKSNRDNDTLTPLVKAGFVTTQEIDGQKVYSMTSEKFSILVNAAVDDKTFKEIGVDIDAKVITAFPNSSGGRTSAAQVLSCLYQDNNGKFCQGMITPEEFENDPRYKNALIRLYERSSKQTAGEYSVDYCFAWLNSMTSAVNMPIFPESCYGAWKLSLSERQLKLAEERGNVGIYLDNTVIQTFTLIATSQKGLEYIEFLKATEEFGQVVTKSTGMRGSGIESVPPVFLDSFIAPNEPYFGMPFPFSKLTNGIKTVLKEYGK